MNKRFAILLSGCGYKEGSEITEAVSAIVSLSRLGAELAYFSPKETLAEAQKIARDQAKDISELNASEFDGLVIPGGYGSAKVFSNWAEQGANCEVHKDVARLISEFHEHSSPIAALCISPVLVAKVLGAKGVTLTIGSDKETAMEIEKTGAQHVNCKVTDFVTDRENKVVTTPAYMCDATPGQVSEGIEKALKEFHLMS